uniref:Uncharacterized protein n=1 Tax=Vespula pensylvanica TaxID=30213 RepID=A0A834KPX3_VESPE|nr:hypothetical protein H0235_013210 [Vespula pensylvanica]
MVSVGTSIDGIDRNAREREPMENTGNSVFLFDRIRREEDARGSPQGEPLSPISTLIARSQVKYRVSTWRFGTATIAYSISETVFTIQFAAYQPPPIRYLDFTWLS